MFYSFIVFACLMVPSLPRTFKSLASDWIRTSWNFFSSFVFNCTSEIYGRLVQETYILYYFRFLMHSLDSLP